MARQVFRIKRSRKRKQRLTDLFRLSSRRRRKRRRKKI